MAALSAAVEFGRVTAGQPSRSQPTRPTRARIIRSTRRCDLLRSSPLLLGSPEHAREVPRIQQRAVGTRSAAADGDFECWSNANGAVLSGPFRQDLYAAERAFLWNSIDVGGRSAVVRLSDGSLWVHSPVRLDGRYKDALAALGPVKSIISPNFEHVSYAQEWISAYPDATSFCPPGGKEHFPNIAFAEEIGEGNECPAEWGGEIRCLFLNYEHNPFTGKPFFNEVIFLHEPSGTLICTDVFWNYPDSGVPPGTALWKFGMDQVYRPFYNHLMIKDREAQRAAMRVLFEEWEWDAILPCHGSFIASGGKALLRKHLGM